MSNRDLQLQHQSRDRFLSILSRVDGLVGKFVQTYPGAEASQSVQDWLNEWFVERTNYYFDHISDSTEKRIGQNSSDLTLLKKRIL